MSIDKYGNDLADPVPQAGWTIEADGFGLLQANIKFKWDKSNADSFTAKFYRGARLGDIYPDVSTQYEDMTLWKASMSFDKTEIMIISADFAGLDSRINSGLSSNWQVAMVGASASEAIEHHPNFLEHFCTSIEGSSVLAGFPPAKGGFDPSPSTNPNRALWTPYVASQGATQGFQFVGFLPNQTKAEVDAGHINIKAGVKNYYKPSATLRCLSYFKTDTVAMQYASYVGWTTDGTQIGLPTLYTKLASDSGYSGNFQYNEPFKSKIKRTFLITSSNVEVYGSIYKVTMDLMLSGISGWDPDIYPTITSIPA